MSTPISAGKGMHHLGLVTKDMEATLAFYEGVLGFPAVVCETMTLENGGSGRHAFLDAGRGELVAFMEFNGIEVEGKPFDFDAGINRGLGFRGGVVHFAFRVDDAEELEKKQLELREKGVEVTDVVDHGWCRSIYFADPNGLQLEFCHLSVELGGSHVSGRDSAEWTRWARR